MSRMIKLVPSIFTPPWIEAGANIPSQLHSTLIPSAFSIPGDGVTEVDLDIYAADQANNPLPNRSTVIIPEIIRPAVANCSVIAAATMDPNAPYVVTIIIRDEDGFPIPDVDASEVVLAATGTGNTVGQPTGRTNQIGELYGSFESSVEEIKTLSATLKNYANAPIAIPNTAEVTVGDPEPPPSGSDPDFDMDDSSALTVRATSAGVSWDTSDPDVTVQAAPAGRTGFAMRFRNGPDAPGEDSNAEQRFTLPVDVDEFWIEYYLHAPSNYVHRNDSPSNNKGMRLWGDDYGATNKVGFSTWYNSGYANNSSVRIDRTTDTGVGPSSPSGFPGQTSPTAAYGIVLNDWVRVRIYYKMESATNANDQLTKIWFDDVLALEWQNQHQVYDTVRPYWNQGYLMGAANSGYLAITDFYINGVKMWWTNDPEWT